MSEQQSKSSAMAKDTVVYMVAKGVEGVFGVLSISLYTYLFVTDEVGRYTILNTSSQIAAMVCIQWLLQSAMRYVNDFEARKEMKPFYSTVFFAWLKLNIAVVSCYILTVWICSYASIPYISNIIERFSPSTLYLMAGVFVSYNTAQLLTALLAAKRRVKLNLLLSLGSVVGKLLTLLTLVQLFGSRLEWIFVSNMLFDGIISVVALWRLRVVQYIGYKNRSAKTLSSFYAYGTPLIGNFITTTVLNNADKYIITGYLGDGATGIYGQNYTLVSSAFTMLTTGIMRGAYPTILKAHSEGKKELTQQLVSKAVRNYLLVMAPAVVGIAVMGHSISVLLETTYREGYRVMFWVALGMMFLGLTEYSNKIWELTGNTKVIFRNSLIGGIVNITLNIVLVQKAGYMVAAYSTFIGFFVYFLLSKSGSRKLMKWHIPKKTYAAIFGSAAIMAVVLYILQQWHAPGKMLLFVYVGIGVVVYGVSIVLSGEVQTEVDMVKNRIGSFHSQNRR